ncbi:MAG: cation:proton antiporter [Candidatus Latescibacteria bacterium]|nr:cation:proton antiporter [Candidatus Latescibacterota bacterium]
MPDSSVLLDLVVVLVASILVLAPSRRLRIPPAVGFLITGVAIGPGALGLVHEPRHVEVLAEVGVSVLLFVIGLEFSLARLREIGRAFLIAGPLQVLGTVAVVGAVVLLRPVSPAPNAAVFAGMLVALSSTAMVLPLILERGELHAPQGRLLLGILLFQDFALVPMLIVTPALAGKAALAAGPSVLAGVAAAGATFLAARYLMPRLVNAVFRSGVRELYAMMAIAVCLGASLATKSLGLSAALGAFLAGILVSESEYAHQVIAEVLPFRDLFGSLFFISIGMLLQARELGGILPQVGGWVLLVVVVKSLVAALVVRGLGFPARIAAITGISLAQVGEFSFVLASVGKTNGLISGPQEQQFLAVAVLSLAMTPFLVRLAGWAGRPSADRLPGGQGAEATIPQTAEQASTPAAEQAIGPGALRGHAAARSEPERSGHVIIVGFGVNGRNLARVLRETGIPYVVLEINPVLVRRARREGHFVRQGDAARRSALDACGLRRAAVVVLAISDTAATRVAVSITRRDNPGAHLIARTLLVAEVAELKRLGADEVIPEEFETSIAIFTRVLRRFHVPGNIVRIQESALREEAYGFLRGRDVTGGLRESISRMIEGALTDTFLIEPDSPAVGQSLSRLDLRGRTGALAIAVVREGKHHLSPDAGFELSAGDVLVLVGDHAALEAAFALLSPPATSPEGHGASRGAGTGPER